MLQVKTYSTSVTQQMIKMSFCHPGQFEWQITLQHITYYQLEVTLPTFLSKPSPNSYIFWLILNQCNNDFIHTGPKLCPGVYYPRYHNNRTGVSCTYNPLYIYVLLHSMCLVVETFVSQLTSCSWGMKNRKTTLSITIIIVTIITITITIFIIINLVIFWFRKWTNEWWVFGNYIFILPNNQRDDSFLCLI